MKRPKPEKTTNSVFKKLLALLILVVFACIAEINVVKRDNVISLFASEQTEATSSESEYLLGTEYSFSYTGSYQEFTAPVSEYYKIEAWGAQGGSYSTTGGKGAYTSGYVYLEKGQKLYIYVGNTGDGVQTATFNGGGAAGGLYYARSGGGSTDIRLTAGAWNNFDSLKSRIMVAAGGGGSTAASYACNGGAAGALTGYAGAKGGSGGGYTVAGGGTQTSGGTAGKGKATATASGFGYGGSGNANHGGGGRRRLLWWWPEVAIMTQL